jgi:hypothetical protein
MSDTLKRSWLRSDRARILFSYSSWAVVCMGIFMIFMLTPWFQQIEALPRGDLFLRILGAPLGVIGAPASLIIWFGMIAFCLREDISPTSNKVFWFIVFFTAAWFGATAYFFAVYNKQLRGAEAPASP